MALGCVGWLEGGAADALPVGWIEYRYCKTANTWGRLWLKSARY